MLLCFDGVFELGKLNVTHPAGGKRHKLGPLG
jgi:hypothetical protein